MGLRESPGFGRLDLFGIPWILSSEMSLFNGLHATPGPFLIHAAPSPRIRSARPGRHSIRRSTALNPRVQAETAGRAGIMAIDIARVGLGIGTNLTPSSLFGKKLSTRRSILQNSGARSRCTPDSIAALWTPDLGRALMRGHDWRFDRNAICPNGNWTAAPMVWQLDPLVAVPVAAAGPVALPVPAAIPGVVPVPTPVLAAAPAPMLAAVPAPTLADVPAPVLAAVPRPCWRRFPRCPRPC